MYLKRAFPFSLPLVIRYDQGIETLYFRPTIFAKLIWAQCRDLNIIPDLTYLNLCLSHLLQIHFDLADLELNSTKVAGWFEEVIPSYLETYQTLVLTFLLHSSTTTKACKTFFARSR